MADGVTENVLRLRLGLDFIGSMIDNIICIVASGITGIGARIGYTITGCIGGSVRDSITGSIKGTVTYSLTAGNIRCCIAGSATVNISGST